MTPLLLLLVAAPAALAFDTSYTSGDRAFVRELVGELPAAILAHDSARIAELESRVANAALEARARARAELTLAVGANFWSAGAVEAKWMVQSSVAMIVDLNAAGRGTPETAGFAEALKRKQALIQQTESALNTADPANLPRLRGVLENLLEGDGHKLSEIYLRLRTLHAGLPPAFAGVPIDHQLLPGLDLARWDDTLTLAERDVIASGATAQLPASVRPSFVKSVLDLFYAVKFPLLDLRYGEILDPFHPNPSLRPDGSAAATLSSFRSLQRVLQLASLFAEIDRAGGGRAYLRSIQTATTVLPGLCGRLEALAGFSAADWAKIRAGGKVIVLDPGHLGGEFADDGRDVSPPGEKGQESYGYREGRDTFVIAQLVRRLLVQCGGLPDANILLTRRGLHDEGGKFFDKGGNLLGGAPGPDRKSSDNLYFRKVVVTLARPDFVISMHTDYSDTLTQHGLVMIPRHPAGLGNGFYKSRAQYDASLRLAQELRGALGRSMYDGQGTPSGKSAQDFLGFEFREYYLTEMDLQIFRDLRTIPAALVEGYDYASPVVRTLMNAVARGHRPGDADVRTMNVDGARFFYHTVHLSYAEGVALAALRFLLQGLPQERESGNGPEPESGPGPAGFPLPVSGPLEN